jgi:ketosteroid isomerase-like protein
VPENQTPQGGCGVHIKKENDVSASPIEVVSQWLQNLLDPDVVNRVVAPDATYVSLNTENPELSKIMPWAGTSRGPQAVLGNLGDMFTRWENQAFNVTTMFASGENVAVFGDFRYKSISLGKVVSSPFSILMKVVDGKVTYLQYLEDSYATAASFRKDGSWTIQTEPSAEPFQV